MLLQIFCRDLAVKPVSLHILRLKIKHTLSLRTANTERNEDENKLQPWECNAGHPLRFLVLFLFQFQSYGKQTDLT